MNEDAMKKLKEAQNQIKAGVLSAFEPWREMNRTGDLDDFLEEGTNPPLAEALDELPRRNPCMSI